MAIYLKPGPFAKHQLESGDYCSGRIGILTGQLSRNVSQTTLASNYPVRPCSTPAKDLRLPGYHFF